MAIRLTEIPKADLSFEAGFAKPAFGMFRDGPGLVDALYRRLEPHGLRLMDIRWEHGAGNVGEQHVLVYLFNYSMTVRIRVDRVEILCSDLPRDYLQRLQSAIRDTLYAVNDYDPELPFRTFAMAVGLHAKLEAMTARDYLSRFVTEIPAGLGPLTGRAVVFYFGPHEDRMFSTVTADASALLPDGLFVRVHGIWDASRASADALGGRAEAFVRQALESLGLVLERS